MLSKFNFVECYLRAALWAALFISAFSLKAFSWQTPFSAGFDIGGGFSKYSSKESELSSESSYSIGSHVNWKTNEWISFDAGAQFSKEGAFSFFTLPLLSKISSPIGDVEPYLAIGPYFSVVLSKASQEMRAFDFGSLLGLGCFIPVSHKWGFTADFRFKIGALDLDSREANTLRTRTFSLSVGTVFPI